MNKNDKIFVAGGSGLVGSAILRKLLEKGYTNIVTSYYIRPLDAELQQRVRNIEVDLTNQQATIDFFRQEKPDYVFLAAARVGGIVANNTYKAEFIYQNIMIAANTINASYDSGVKKLLNLGSSCIYPKNCPQPMKESHLLTGLLEPTNEPYAIAKISAIKLCRYYNEQYGTNYISVMPTNMYGPGDNYDLFNSHVLPALIRKFHIGKLLVEKDFESIKCDFLKLGNGCIDNGENELCIRNNTEESTIMKVLEYYGINISNEGDVTVTLWGTGSPYREFLYVDDLAEAIIYLMEQYNYADIGEFVNIGTGKETTISDLAGIVSSIVGFNGGIIYDNTKPDGTPKKLLDVTRMSDLGWNARTSFTDGIQQAYNWYISHHL